MHNFDPVEFVRGLQQILVSDKKRIGFLFGAGTSVAKKTETSPQVPAVFQMTEEIITTLSVKDNKFKNCLLELKGELGGDKFNIETILSKLEQKNEVVGPGKLNGLDKVGLCSLIDEIKAEIRKKVSIHKNITDIAHKKDMVQTDFAEWIARSESKYPVEIYTTNYDLLFEVALEFHKVPFFTGFTGSYEPFFAPELVEDFDFCASHTKLWKIHGSVVFTK